ncbi:Na+/H+ antiporter subunit G [Marinimicrobium locisalis]|uniref:Na+/H+ antiporter subunit G n=1 Tax=Marinimicrobium locisalis TaxID=546022 RepID=UPI00322185E3
MEDTSWLEWLICLLLLIGASFALIGSLGLVRLPDFFMRLHGPTKATTLGVGSIIVGSMLFFSTRGEGLSLHELLIALFLFITAPVSAHIVGKAALHVGLPYRKDTQHWEQDS